MLIKICQIISAPEKKNNDSVVIKKIEPQYTDKHTVTPQADNKGNIAAQQPTHTKQQTKTAEIKPQAANSSILNLSSILSDKKPDEKKDTQLPKNHHSTCIPLRTLLRDRKSLSHCFFFREQILFGIFLSTSTPPTIVCFCSFCNLVRIVRRAPRLCTKSREGIFLPVRRIVFL